MKSETEIGQGNICKSVQGRYFRCFARIIFPVLAVFTVTACDKFKLCAQETHGVIANNEAVTPSPLVLAHPPFRLDLLSSSQCPDKVIDKSLSPSENERPIYIERTNTGKLTSIVNLSCIEDAYSPRDLKMWAIKGDPIAIYASLDLAHIDMLGVCFNLSGYEEYLNRAAEVTIYQPVLKKKISRLPEAYEVIYKLRKACRLDGSSYREAARNAGLDDQALARISLH